MQQSSKLYHTIPNSDHDDAAICAETLRLSFVNLLGFYGEAAQACRVNGSDLPASFAAQIAAIERLATALIVENGSLLRTLPAPVLADFAARVACPI